jgi:hypothetical protein
MKTIEQKQLEAKAYIAKSSQHLFVVNKDIFYKIIPFTVDGKTHYATLTIVKDVVRLNVIKSDRFKWELKQSLFPQYNKIESIPYFKAMRELVAFIQTEINLTDNKELIEKIKERVKTLELVK